ncbi:MAG TPA: ABC transporter permease [Blastocatellia bacterium]|nr:ABC transporter permease [Blastocatellia bacterium]
MPNWDHIVREHLAALRLPPEREIEIVEELALHLEAAYEAALAAGLSAAEAEARAMRGYDWRLLECELSRAERPSAARALQPPLEMIERRGGLRMGSLLQDLRFGARMLLKGPGFTLIAVITLALGIGANTAIFSLIDAVLLKLLPVKDPAQLVALSKTARDGENRIAFSYPLFQDLRERNQVFSGILAYSGVALNLSGNGQTERVAGQLVSGNFFSVLGVQPLLGRVFTDDDNKSPGAHPVTILSHSFWQRRFAGNPNVVGETVRLNGYPFTIVGVAPHGFFGVEVGAAPDLWAPMMMQPQVSGLADRLQMRNNFWVNLMARLKSGVSAQQSQAGVDALYRQINRDAPGLSPKLRDFLLGQHIQLRPAGQGLSGLRNQFKQPLLVLMGAVGLVLLIACANIANLLLARATARQKEIAVRLALGAGRARLVAQLLTESFLLSFLGGLFGLLFAFWGVDFLLSFLSQARFTLELQPDLRVLGFNLGVAVLTGILFGLAPALQATRPNLIEALKNEIPALTGARGGFELRKLLVVAQVALSLLLLIGAGLFIRTLQNLNGIDLGFRADKVLLLSMNPGLNGYSPERIKSFYAQLLEWVNRLPGVQAASFADMPLMGGAWVDGIEVEGYKAAAGQDMSVSAKKVGPKFFETMGIPLLKGRDFNVHDEAGAPKVAVINETLARDFFGNDNPLGRRIGVGEKPEREIIGVIKDTKYRDLKKQAPRTVYVPLAQPTATSAELTLHVRTVGEPTNLVDAIRREVESLDKNLPVYNVRTFTDLVAQSIYQERLIATLSSFFGLLALLLASLGLYGVMAYSVARRTREIGIRLALGAQTSDVLKLVLRQGMGLALVGIGLGVVAALALTRVLGNLLYGVSPTDLLTFVSIPLTLTGVALLACYIPARRATKVDPLTALRHE